MIFVAMTTRRDGLCIDSARPDVFCVWEGRVIRETDRFEDKMIRLRTDRGHRRLGEPAATRTHVVGIHAQDVRCHHPLTAPAASPDCQ